MASCGVRPGESTEVVGAVWTREMKLRGLFRLICSSHFFLLKPQEDVPPPSRWRRVRGTCGMRKPSLRGLARGADAVRWCANFLKEVGHQQFDRAAETGNDWGNRRWEIRDRDRQVINALRRGSPGVWPPLESAVGQGSWKSRASGKLENSVASSTDRDAQPRVTPGGREKPTGGRTVHPSPNTQKLDLIVRCTKHSWRYTPGNPQITAFPWPEQSNQYIHKISNISKLPSVACNSAILICVYIYDTWKNIDCEKTRIQTKPRIQ